MSRALPGRSGSQHTLGFATHADHRNPSAFHEAERILGHEWTDETQASRKNPSAAAARQQAAPPSR